jgi:hypothetical protein
MSWLPPGKPKRPRGRPKGTTDPNKERTITAIRITQWVKEILDHCKDVYKVTTYDAALRAYMRDKGHKIGELQKKVDALSQELTNYMAIEVNNR